MDESSRDFKQILRNTEQAFKFGGQDDPETALLHARKAIEAVCKDVYKREGKERLFETSLGTLIAKSKRFFPKKVFYSMKVIQNVGGANAHEDIDDCLDPAFKFFSIVIDWYFRNYRKTPIPDSVQLARKSAILPAHENLDIGPELSRAFSLFGYECDGATESVLWNHPFRIHELFDQRGRDFYRRYHAWLSTKRKFSLHEIVNGIWLKVASHGPWHFKMKLNTDGSLVDRSLFSFDEQHWGDGAWKLVDGVLRLNIHAFEVDIFGSRDGMHSGIEDKEGQRNAYFRVVHSPASTWT